MTILRSNTKRIDTKLVGVLLPMELHAYFSLYTVAKGITKTVIIKDELNNWAHATQLCGEIEEELIKEIIEKIREKWNAIKIKTPEKSIKDFKQELKTELRIKGISEQHINLIMKGI